MVADARAGDDAGIRELDGGADAPEALRRQRVDGNDKVGAHGLHRTAHELGGLQSRCAEDAGRQHADIRERTEGGAALQVARGGHMIGGAGTDDVGRHGAVAESDHEGGIDRSFEESAQLVAERERRALRVRGVLGRKRAQVERDVGPARLAEGARGRLALHRHRGHGAAAARPLGEREAVDGVVPLRRAEQRVRLQRQVRPPCVHKTAYLPLNLVYCSHYVP